MNRVQTFAPKLEWDTQSLALATMSGKRNIFWSIGQLAFLLIRPTRHHGLSETQIYMCQTQNETMDYIPSQAVQSSMLAGAMMREGGRQETEKCALQSVWLVLGATRASHAGSGSCAATVISGRHRHLKIAQFKFEKFGHLEKNPGYSRKTSLLSNEDSILASKEVFSG
jgi:hypothetical protein